MEGVLVSAKKVGSTITVTVVSNQEGRYRFPSAKLPRVSTLRRRQIDLRAPPPSARAQPRYLPIQLRPSSISGATLECGVVREPAGHGAAKASVRLHALSRWSVSCGPADAERW
jgi:hypothetical protein